MSIIQVVFVIFVLFALLRAGSQYTARDISFREWILWTVFWVVVGVAAVLPRTTDLIASKLGLETGRGVDLLVYIAIPVLFYAIFRLMARIDSLQATITEVVRHVGIAQAVEPKEASHKEHHE